MKKFFQTFLFILFIFEAQAKIVRFDVSQANIKKFSFKDACQVMGHKNLILVEANNNYQLDCMGRTISALDFCRTKYPEDNKLLRGYVDQKKKEVVCQSGNSAILAMTCDSKHNKYCLSPEKSCERLRNIFAHRLNLDHQSVLPSTSEYKNRRLNCYFSASTDMNSLINDPLKLPPR